MVGTCVQNAKTKTAGTDFAAKAVRREAAETVQKVIAE